MVRQVMTMKMPGRKKTKMRRMGLRFIVIQFLIRRAKMFLAEGKVTSIFFFIFSSSKPSSFGWLEQG